MHFTYEKAFHADYTYYMFLFFSHQQRFIRVVRLTITHTSLLRNQFGDTIQ